MTRPAPLLGCYLGVQTFKARTGVLSEANTDAAVLAYLNDASRAFERDTQRYFFPYLTTNLYRWPQFAPTATWEVWTEEDLLAVTLLQVAVSGQGAAPITLTNYFLEPQWAGPPYSRIEIDLSSTDALQSGPTPQRAIGVTGQWGYTNATQSLGTIAGLSSGSPTTATITGTAPDTGDVLLVDSEAIYVSLGGTTGPTLQRGVNGTAVATHVDGSAVSRYVAPADVQSVILGDALQFYLRNQVVWQMVTVGGGLESAPTVPNHTIPGHEDRRLEIIEHYERIRSGAI